MNKIKQIWEILFPLGILQSYVLPFVVVAINAYLGISNTLAGKNDLLIFISCIGIAGGLKLWFDVWKERRAYFSHVALVDSVIESLSDRLREIHMEETKGFTNISPERVALAHGKCLELINAEIERRKTLASESNSGKP